MNKLMRIPLISVLNGLILTTLEYAIFNLSLKAENLFILDYYLVINTIIALALFYVAGKLFLKDMTRNEVLRSATIFSIYYLVLMLLQNVLLKLGAYSSIMTVFFIPTYQYSIISHWIMRLSIKLIYWGLIPSILAPFFYLIFTKKNISNHEDV